MTDTQTPRPSLAEMRELLRPCQANWPNKCDGHGLRGAQNPCVICGGTKFDSWRDGVRPPAVAFATLLAMAEAYIPLVTYRESAEYHEDFGDVLWWRLSKHSGKPEEPPYCGSPLNDDWPYGMDGDDEGDTWEYDFKGDSLKWTPLPMPYDAPKVRP